MKSFSLVVDSHAFEIPRSGDSRAASFPSIHFHIGEYVFPAYFQANGEVINRRESCEKARSHCGNQRGGIRSLIAAQPVRRRAHHQDFHGAIFDDLHLCVVIGRCNVKPLFDLPISGDFDFRDVIFFFQRKIKTGPD